MYKLLIILVICCKIIQHLTCTDRRQDKESSLTDQSTSHAERFVRAEDLKPYMIVEVEITQGMVLQNRCLVPFADWLYGRCPLLESMDGECAVYIIGYSSKPRAYATIEVHSVARLSDPASNRADLICVYYSTEKSDRHSFWFYPDEQLRINGHFNPDSSRRKKKNRQLR